MSRWIMIVILSCLPFMVQAEENKHAQRQPSAEAMILDGLVFRPLSLAATAVGTGIFIVTLPFSAIGGNVDEAGDTLIMQPARATFGPCLGCQPSHARYHRYEPPAEAEESQR